MTKIHRNTPLHRTFLPWKDAGAERQVAVVVLRSAAGLHLTSPTCCLCSALLLALAAGNADAAVSTWVGAGSTSNFSDNLNWDAPPTPDCDMIFAANAFAAKGSPVNDMTGLTVNALELYEAYRVSGNGITCKIINNFNATTATVSLPLATAGGAVMTVTVLTAGATLNLSGLISGAGPMTFGGPGRTRLNGIVNNTLTGISTVSMGTLALDSSAAVAIAGPLVISSGAIVNLLNAPDISDTVTVTVDGVLDISAATGNNGTDTETIAGLLGSGSVILGANSLGCTSQITPTEFTGGFSGTGGFHQATSGTQVLSGNASSYTGGTTLAGGSLRIWGTQPSSPVSVTNGTLVLANDCSVGAVTLSGGATSKLSCNETLVALNLHGTTPSLVLGSGTTFEVVAKGAAATQYSNVTTAAVSLNGAILTIDTSAFSPAISGAMTIIDNTGLGPVVGTFAGLPEGKEVVSATDGSVVFHISYIGGTGNDVTLIRAIPDITPPVISNIGVGSLTTTSVAINWTTNETSDSQVQFGLTLAYGSTTTVDTSLVLSHGQPITGLTVGTLYHFRVLSQDFAGNLATSADGTFTTSTDVTAPVISLVSAGSLTVNSAAISWTTDETSDTQVNFGLTTAYGTSTVLDVTKVLSHSAPLASLTAGTLYHFQVLSRDAAGNLATSANATFTTSAAVDSTAPVISAIAATAVTATTATIGWTTDELSDTQVEFGLTTA